jgi:hypothetical protein
MRHGSISIVHFLFEALILRVQSTRKMSALPPFLRVVGGMTPPPTTRKNGILPAALP